MAVKNIKTQNKSNKDEETFTQHFINYCVFTEIKESVK